MSLHINNVKTSLLIVLLLSTLVFSVICIKGFYFYRDAGRGPETTAERLLRESQPGTPITISAEDQARLKKESEPGSVGVKIDAATMKRLEAESVGRAQ